MDTVTTSPRRVADRITVLLFAALLVLPGAPRLSYDAVSCEAGVAAPGSDRASSQEQPAPAITWKPAPGLEGAARRLAPEVESILAEARAWTGLPAAPEPFRIELVGSREAMEAALGRKIPEWFAALALPFERRLILATQPAGSIERLRVTLRHELMHLAMADLGEAGFDRLPAWFHEGCAEVFAGDVYLGSLGVSLTWRAWTGDLENLSEFREAFGQERLRAAVGYALGDAFVARLIRVHGQAVIPAIFARVKDGESLDAALVAETGLSIITHEQALREELASPAALLRDFYSQLFLGMMLLLLAVVPFVFARRRRRRRELEARWERDSLRRPDRVTASGEWALPRAEGVDEDAEALEDWSDEDY